MACVSLREAVCFSIKHLLCSCQHLPPSSGLLRGRTDVTLQFGKAERRNVLGIDGIPCRQGCGVQLGTPVSRGTAGTRLKPLRSGSHERIAPASPRQPRGAGRRRSSPVSHPTGPELGRALGTALGTVPAASQPGPTPRRRLHTQQFLLLLALTRIFQNFRIVRH